MVSRFLKRHALLLLFVAVTPMLASAAHVELVLKRMTLSNGVILEPGSLIEILDWQELSSVQYRNFRVLSDAAGKAPSDPKEIYRESAVSFEGTTTPIDLLRVVARPKEQTGCSQQALETAARIYRDHYYRRYPKLIPAGHTQMASVIRLDNHHSGHSSMLSNEWPNKPLHLNVRADVVNTERNLVLVRTSETPPRVFVQVGQLLEPGNRSYHINFSDAEPLQTGQEVRYLLEHQEGKDPKLAPLTSRDANTPHESVGGVGVFGYRGIPVIATHDAQWSVTATPDPDKKK